MTDERKTTLYDRIGEAFIEKAITEFYVRAFTDSMIGHFFFNKDRAAITRKQIDFATAMLGGPRRYKGRALEAVHAELPIRRPHFGRRQVMMREVLDELGLEPELRDAWLKMEEALRPLILTSGPLSCQPGHG